MSENQSQRVTMALSCCESIAYRKERREKRKREGVVDVEQQGWEG